MFFFFFFACKRPLNLRIIILGGCFIIREVQLYTVKSVYNGSPLTNGKVIDIYRSTLQNILGK